ncbi:MAG TPA: hypothetical protein VMX35_00485 [Acidobacteriota bacterium]|nr:hypothetical protein [Acidobacteriota bacterium]
MKGRVAVCVIALTLAFTSLLSAQECFKFDEPLALVKAAKEPRGQSLDIAWSGSVFGIVYDDYWHDKNKTGSFFMVVDSNGKTLFGPKRLAKKQYGTEPKIEWMGDSFAIVHTAGKKTGGNWHLKYYLARYSTTGKKLSEYTLDGIPGLDWYGNHTRMQWTGSELGIFYVADPPEEGILKLIFCKAEADGAPSAGRIIHDYFFTGSDAIWDGGRFVYFGLSMVDEETSQQDKPTAVIMTLDRDGNITSQKKYNDFIYGGFFQGASLIPLPKKNLYLLAFGVAKAGAPPPISNHWYDVYTTQLKIAGGKFSRFLPKNATMKKTGSWSFPTMHRDGKKSYITALLGNAGSSLAFAKMSARGGIKSGPIEFRRPEPACGACPPYSAWGGRECGIVWVYGDLLFNIAIP